MAWRYALKRNRWGAAGFSAAAFLLTLLVARGFYAAAGPSGPTSQLAARVSVLLPDPIGPGTVGGFEQWIGYGSLAFLISLWAVVCAAAATGDEKTGVVGAMLAAGVGRGDLLLWRFLAFASYATLVTVAAASGFMVAVLGEHDLPDAAALAGASASLLALALACYGLALLVGQMTGPRFALPASGAVVITVFLVNSLARVVDGLRAWGTLTPFHYFEASQPLAAGGSFDVRAIEVLVGFGLVCFVGAALAFASRDVGEATWTPPLPALPWPAARATPVILWALGLSGLAATLVEVARHLVAPLLFGPDPRFQVLIRQDVFPSVLGSLWFGPAELLLIGFVITRVAGWSSADDDGRLEAMLAAATSRAAIVIRRGTGLAAAVGVLATSSALTIAFAASKDGLSLSARNLVSATLLLVVFALVFAAAGSVFVALIPRAAAGLLGALTLAMYTLAQVGPLFRWPSWTANLSPLPAAATSLTQGPDLNSLVIAFVVVVAGFAASAFLMQRREVGA